MIAELLSGSSPPLEFFNPFGFLLLASLYGSGAIVARELTVRWRKGWASLLLLGAAYGIVEEGLMVRSFFNPAWPDLGALGVYGRWAGVNWVWAEMLTIYHAVFSIAIPILLVQLVYPTRTGSWVGGRTLKILLLILSILVVLGFPLSPYEPPPLPYAGALVSVALLSWVARRLPARGGAEVSEGVNPPHPFRLWLTGLLGTAAFFILFYASPYIIPQPVATMLLGILLVAVVQWLLTRLHRRGLSSMHQLALVAGALSFLIALAPLQELDKSRADNPTGMTLVALAFAVFLFWLARRVKRDTGSTALYEERAEAGELPPPPDDIGTPALHRSLGRNRGGFYEG